MKWSSDIKKSQKKNQNKPLCLKYNKNLTVQKDCQISLEIMIQIWNYGKRGLNSHEAHASS